MAGEHSEAESPMDALALPNVEINPNQRLSSILLNEFNYLPWSRAVSLALGGRSKLGYVNGAIKAPGVTSSTYESWLCKDQLVMSWLLNSMERRIAEIFSYSESSMHLWKQVKEMYGNQNNSARVFQLKKDISSLQQGGKAFVQHLGNLTSMWNELDVYRPHTTDATILIRRAEEDKIFQLLASLGSEFEDLRSHILMNAELPSFTGVCAIIQREEVRRKVMSQDTKDPIPETRAYVSNNKRPEGKVYKGKRPDLKCSYCDSLGHTRDKCWILHPELKPNFLKETKGPQRHLSNNGYKANYAATSSTEGMVNFTTNPTSLINDFAAYLHNKQLHNNGDEAHKATVAKEKNHTALLGQFAGFLAEQDHVSHKDIPGISSAFSTALNASNEHDYWIIDSGATDHMTNKINNLHDFKILSKPSQVSVANGKGALVVGKGKVNLLSKHIESAALYIPSFPFQLLSIGAITNSLNCLAIFSPHNVVFQDIITKRTIGEGFFLNGLYYLGKDTKDPKVFQVSSSVSQDQQLWHQRLAHPSEKVMSFLFPKLCKDKLHCDVCHLSKFSRLPFESSTNKASHPFEIIHSDIWGPILESFDGYRYFVTFVDDFTKMTWLYLLKFKSELPIVFQDFHKLVGTQFASKIHILRSDNGTEYMSHNMSQYLSIHGILHQTTCVGTPQQNGVAERKNRDLLEKTRSIMFHMNVPKKFWSQGVLTAAYLINRLPSKVLSFKSPYEMLKGRKIDLSHLRVFGSTCFVHNKSPHHDKLDPRATKCIFMGYSSTQKGYKCYNPITNKLLVSRDVRFNENMSYFSKKLSDADQGEFLSDMFPLPSVPYYQENPPSCDTTSLSPELAPSQVTDVEPPAPSLAADAPPLEPPVQIRRNPSRVRQPPLRLHDYVTYTSRYPLTDFVSYKQFSPSHISFLSALDHTYEPQTFQEANKHKVWQIAMRDELQALHENKTWSVIKLPTGKKAVGSRWVYKTKFNSDGTIERHKARLVARGFTQTYGLDYKETFAPVAKMNTVRVLLSVAVNQSWPLYQMDVKNAFLHGELEEEVYMKLPPGHPQSCDPDMVCQLHKSIYGLKQSPRAWYAKLSSILEELGFQRSSADSSLFVCNGSVGKVIILIYVDDLIVTGDSDAEIQSLKLALRNKFAIKDLGRLKYFLGIEIATSQQGLFLNQRKYILDLLKDSNLMDCKPARTPLDSKLQLTTHGKVLSNITEYQRLVGKLIYLTITRPDISYAVSIVSQFMHAPTSVHMQIVKRILRYLKASVGRGILMTKNDSTTIMGYTDADWAGNSLDRKSTTGFCTFVGGNLVTWRSKKQSVVARSSAEAEYRAMASTACELIWLKSLLFDLGFHSKEPISMFCDNQAAMHIASNPVFHERTKHIEVDCHYVRAQVQANIINTHYTRSHDQLADLFTKPLPMVQFMRLLSKLGSRNPLDPA